MASFAQQPVPGGGFHAAGMGPAGGGTGPGSFAMPTTTLELSVSCKNLCDMDTFSKSDPLCVMYQQVADQKWVEVGRTEMLKNTLNPSWQHKFVLDYCFEQRQLVKFEVYDWDNKSTNVKDHDFLARLECTLGSIVSSPRKQFVSMIKDGPSKKGQFTIIAEEVSGCNDMVKIQFAAKGLDKKDTFGKSDPFYIISRATGNGQWTVVAKSGVIKNTLNPTWPAVTMHVRELCNGDYDRQLRMDVYDWDDNSDNDLIGSFTTTLNDLKAAMEKKTMLPCVNPKKLSKKKYKHSGEVYLKFFGVQSAASFVEYIQGGTALNFSVAVDFTASNGDPRNPNSLHYTQGGYVNNQYSTAIRAVGDIIQDYDSDKQFPALGFGAKVPPHGQVSHEFFLNLRPDTPYCAGVEGILQAYHTSLQNVTLYGPTNFSPVINHVAKFASAYQDGRQYFVLLIITDGIITDIDETRNAIINASNLPMSVIIVGVGNEDFSAMEALDSDNGMLRSGSRVAARDIVQFVELRKFLQQGNTWNKEMLAKHVLAEVPKQLTGWMTMRGVKPVKT